VYIESLLLISHKTGIPEPPLVPRYIPVGSAAPSVVVAKPKKKPRSKPAEIFEIYNTEIQRLDEIPLLPTQPPISLTENSDHEPLTYPQSLRPAVLADESEQEGYDTHKLTCAINLICYRSRSGGCEMRQVQVAKRDRFEDEESFQKMLNNNPQLVQTDQQFFSRLQRIYLRDMCGFWRQNLTLKSLSSIGLLEVTTAIIPVSQDLMGIIVHPNNPRKNSAASTYHSSGNLIRI
jgi:hypothetical protein